MELLFDAYVSISIETTQITEKCKISKTERARTIFFNEPELTYTHLTHFMHLTQSYMHLTHFTCLFYVF